MRKIIAITTLALLVAAGCSNTPSQGNRSLLAETPDPGEKAGNAKEGGDKKGRKKRGASKAAAVPGGNTDVAAGGGIDGEVDVPGADEEEQYPTAFAEITESNPDGKSQGITPEYAEMVAASVEGMGKEVRITLAFRGELPQQMPNDKTIMVVGFQMLRGKNKGYAFAGQATDKGWKPYAGGKSQQTKFPGSFDVRGDQIVITVPWSYTDGAYPFKWLATSNWFQSLANTTHYKFDLIPNKDQANYPG